MDTIRIKSQEVLDKTRRLIQPLKDIGLAALPYSRGPLGPAIFSMSLGPDAETIRFWSGTADMQVVNAATSPKRQAILRVSEKTHEIRLTLPISAYFVTNKIVHNANWASSFPIILPTGTKFAANPKTVRLLKGSARQDRNDFHADTNKLSKLPHNLDNFTNSGHYRYSVEVVATVPSFDNSFLIGYDEVKCFIAQLPGHPQTLTEASDLLRPKTAPLNALRQGEWFFVPIKGDELEDVLLAAGRLQDCLVSAHDTPLKFFLHQKRLVGNRTVYNIYNDYPILELLRPLEKDSSHCSIWIEVKGKQYAWDEVKDSRPHRHTPLVLEQWHRVERNREVVVQPVQTASGRTTVRKWD